MSDNKQTPDFPSLAECKIRELYNINRGITHLSSKSAPGKQSSFKSLSSKPRANKEELIRDLSRIQMLITKSPGLIGSQLKNSLHEPISSLKGNNILAFPSSNSPFLDSPTT